MVHARLRPWLLGAQPSVSLAHEIVSMSPSSYSFAELTADALRIVAIEAAFPP